MSKGWKIALIVLGLFVLLGLSVCGAAYMWFESNKDALMKMGQEVRDKATAFAKDHDNEGCLVESFAQLDTCKSMGAFEMVKCNATSGIFLDICLKESSASPDFCADVPQGTNILELASWAVETCVKRGRAGDDACGRHMQHVQKFCSTKPAE